MLASIFTAHKQKAQPVHAWGWQCLRHVEDRELGENRRGRGLPEAFGVLHARPRGFCRLPLSSVWCEGRLSQGSFHWFLPLGIFQGPLCPFYGLLLISIGCIGKNILLKMERFLRPLQSEWLPFCCDGLRLLAHFHAPLKFFQGCKSSLVSCPYKFKGPGCPQAKGSATRVPRINRINTLSGSWERTL